MLRVSAGRRGVQSRDLLFPSRMASSPPAAPAGVLQSGCGQGKTYRLSRAGRGLSQRAATALGAVGGARGGHGISALTMAMRTTLAAFRLVVGPGSALAFALERHWLAAADAAVVFRA